MPSSVRPSLLSPGDVIGQYMIRGLIGNGGFSVVYLAEDIVLERPVAIKQLQREDFTREGSREWFMREARLTANLRHPNIVNIINLLEVHDTLYLIMEYLPGNLLSLLHQQGPLDRATLLAVAADTCRALESMHSRGIIHRDLKPDNILFAQPRHFKLADFGLAHVDPAERYGAADASGPQPGTLLYMSPEQALGQAVTPQSDLYSFAVVLYEAIGGYYYLDYDEERDDENTLIDRIAHAAPLPLKPGHPSVSAAVEAPLCWALSKSPSARPASAREFLAEFRRALAPRRNSSARRNASRPRNRAPRTSETTSEALQRELQAIRRLRDVEGAPEQAVHRLRPLLSRYPESPEVIAEWGETLVALGQILDGFSALLDATRRKAALPFAQLALARLYHHEYADPQAASEALVAAVMADPDLAYAVLYDEIAGALGNEAEYERYVKAFRRAAALSPTAPILHTLGMVLALHPARVSESQAAFEAALQRDARYGPAIVGLGTLLVSQGQLQRGIALLEAGVDAEFPPVHPADHYKAHSVYQPQHLYLALAVAYAQRQEFVRSLAAAHQVFELAPQELDEDASALLEAYVNAAHSWLAAGHYERAAAFLRELIPLAQRWGDMRPLYLLQTVQALHDPAHRASF